MLGTVEQPPVPLREPVRGECAEGEPWCRAAAQGKTVLNTVFLRVFLALFRGFIAPPPGGRRLAWSLPPATFSVPEKVSQVDRLQPGASQNGEDDRVPGTERTPERGGFRRGLGRLGRAIWNAPVTALCAVTQPLQQAALQNQGNVSVGIGASAGIGAWFAGASAELGLDITADSSGNIGIGGSIGGNPGFMGVASSHAGAHAIARVEFSSSTSDGVSRGVEGYYSGGAGFGPVAVTVSRNLDGTSSTVTGSVGAGVGGFVSGTHAFGAHATALVFSCRQ